MLTNYHTHCTWCDGQADIATMARAAYELGYKALGFSSHSPLPFANVGNLELGNVPQYCDDVRAAAHNYKDKGLEIYLGIEAEWIEGVVSPRDALISELGLDYSIGSAHYIDLPETGRFAIDIGMQEFNEHVSRLSNPDNVWKNYFCSLSALIVEGGFNILGHFDLVRKNSEDGQWFDCNSKAFHNAALEAASLLAGKDIIVEINVGGVSRGKVKSPYPEKYILDYLHSLGVHITISADAHAPSHLGQNMGLGRTLAEASGYTEAAALLDGTWTMVPL